MSDGSGSAAIDGQWVGASALVDLYVQCTHVTLKNDSPPALRLAATREALKFSQICAFWDEN